MMLTFLINVAIFVATLAVIFISFFKWRFQYWQRRNLPTLPAEIPFGHDSNPLTTKENMGLKMKRYYDQMKEKGWKHGGLYLLLGPAYLPIDLDFVKNVLTKDFQYFTDRVIFYDEETDPLSAHLFALKGQKWRPLRTKLTPTFTSGKMKMMFQTLIDCAPYLLAKIDKSSLEKTPVDIKEMLGCFTTDIIGSCAFGLDCNVSFSFSQDSKHLQPPCPSLFINFARIQIDIQEKVREEVNTVLQKHGKMTYEAIQEMKYLDQVINETLRMYPPLPVLTRMCVKDYKIPDENITIEKGIFVVIPVYGIHYDEEYYPDPTKFDPERFSEENKNSRHHYSHLPFGEGPRNCIGLRFGLMQSKVGLASLLKSYKFSVNEKTEEPLKMKVFDPVLGVDGCIWLNSEKCKIE